MTNIMHDAKHFSLMNIYANNRVAATLWVNEQAAENGTESSDSKYYGQIVRFYVIEIFRLIQIDRLPTHDKFLK